MNIKSLALSVLIGASALGQAPVSASPTTCAFRNSQELIEFTCDHTMRTNANGHKVNDIVFFDNAKRHDISVIYWMDGESIEYSEVFMNGKRTVMSGYIAKNGAWCVSNNATQFCIH